MAVWPGYPERRTVKRRATDPVPPPPVAERRVAQRRVHVQGPFELDGPVAERTRTHGRRATDVVVAAPRRV